MKGLLSFPGNGLKVSNTPDKSQCESTSLGVKKKKKEKKVEIDALFSAYATSGPVGWQPA